MIAAFAMGYFSAGTAQAALVMCTKIHYTTPAVKPSCPENSQKQRSPRAPCLDEGQSVHSSDLWEGGASPETEPFMTDPLQPQRCARLLRALADPDRLRIIRMLRAGPLNVGEVASSLDIQVVNASHHLGVLRNAGLVGSKRQGRFILYQLPPHVFQATDSAEYLDLGCCRLEMPKPDSAAK
jgi:DNA-binding transcriptional ArsR family regulator